MKGDFSRWRAPNARRQGYLGPLMQQGRLYTDSDWNEDLTSRIDRDERTAEDVIGPSGTPKDDPGFAIAPGGGGFSIGAGRFHVGGMLVENPAPTSYDDQSGADLDLPPFTEDLAEGAEALVYLEARKEHVTALEDPLLADPALGGPDTATRLRAGWRVGLRPLQVPAAQRAEIIAAARCGRMPDLPGFAPSTGRMRAGTAPAGELPDDADCLIPPEAGYLSQENQLYRIQIVTGGTRAQARFVWSRENGAVTARLERNADGAFVLRGDRDDDALGFVSGGWVEVYDDHDTALGRTGRLTRMTLAGGVASFTPGIGNFEAMVNPRLRRWDHDAAGPSRLPLLTTPTVLERGVQVAFTAGSYAEGDFWVVEARAATGTVIWPPRTGDAPDAAVPPMGWPPRYAPLALVRRSGDGIAGNVVDLRARLPQMVCLQAEDVRFDDSTCNLDADTVQQALEALCARLAAGTCSVVVANARELAAALRALRPGQSARICLRGGQFQLPRPIDVQGLGHLTLTGAGPQTVVSVAEGEAAFVFRDCASVRVTEMSISGGRPGVGPDPLRQGRMGAITAIDCGEVSVERVTASCRAGRDRAAACISTRNARPRGTVLVRDCRLRVGQAQIGVNVIGARRAVVETNLLLAVPGGNGSRIRDRITADPVLVSRLSRGLMWFRDSVPPGLGDVRIVTERGEEIARQPLRNLRPEFDQSSFALAGRAAPVQAFLHRSLSQTLPRAIARNRAGRIADAAEMRGHLRNVLSEALRGGGRARIGPTSARVLDLAALQLPTEAFMAQGIVVAGDAVDEARIVGNRIEGATDGIRVAASSSQDPLPPRWRAQRPPNTVSRALIEGNVIAVRPLSNVTAAFGVYLGHVDRATLSGNAISRSGDGTNGQFVQPHWGVHQFGWRGAHLVVTDNTVADLYNGYGVVPSLSDNVSGLWRLRDNSASGSARAYVTAPEVEVL